MSELLQNSCSTLFSTNPKERWGRQGFQRRRRKEWKRRKGGNKDTHTHTKRKTKGREAGKRKEPKEGRTKERTTNIECN